MILMAAFNVAGLFDAPDTHQHLSPVRTGAMFEEVDTLPRAQREVPIIHRDREAGIRQHGTDVGGGVVGSFKVVGVPIVGFGHKVLHEGLEVGAGGGVPVFVEGQRSAGVRQKEETHPFADIPRL